MTEVQKSMWQQGYNVQHRNLQYWLTVAVTHHGCAGCSVLLPISHYPMFLCVPSCNVILYWGIRKRKASTHILGIRIWILQKRVSYWVRFCHWLFTCNIHSEWRKCTVEAVESHKNHRLACLSVHSILYCCYTFSLHISTYKKICLIAKS